MRVNGEDHERVILGFAQTGKSRDSVYPDEERAVLGMAPRLRALSDGGMKGIVVDSAIRGHAVKPANIRTSSMEPPDRRPLQPASERASERASGLRAALRTPLRTQTCRLTMAGWGRSRPPRT